MNKKIKSNRLCCIAFMSVCVAYCFQCICVCEFAYVEELIWNRNRKTNRIEKKIAIAGFELLLHLFYNQNDCFPFYCLVGLGDRRPHSHTKINKNTAAARTSSWQIGAIPLAHPKINRPMAFWSTFSTTMNAMEAKWSRRRKTKEKNMEWQQNQEIVS